MFNFIRCRGRDEEETKSNSIAKTLRDAEKVLSARPLLLFLGCGESGKSTFFKQLKVINSQTEKDTETQLIDRVNIQHMLINDAVTLIRGPALPSVIAKLGDQLLPWSKTLHDLNDGQEPTVQSIKALLAKLCQGKEVGNVFVFTPAAAFVIHTIWKEELSTKLFEFRHLLQLGDHCKHFFDHVIEIGKPNWVPSEDDIVRARVKTTGVCEQAITKKLGNSTKVLRLVDVGGQRSERRKWIPYFSSAAAVMFVVAISEYNELCIEDNETPRSQESFVVFQQICREEHLRPAGIVVFFNKLDVLKEKVERFPFGDYVDDFTGSGSWASVCRYMETKYDTAAQKCFLETFCDPRPTLFHFTTAIDAANVTLVFDSVCQIVLMNNLTGSALV